MRVIIPFTPGGTMDPVVNIVRLALQQELGQPVVLDHRPGGATACAASVGVVWRWTRRRRWVAAKLLLSAHGHQSDGGSNHTDDSRGVPAAPRATAAPRSHMTTKPRARDTRRAQRVPPRHPSHRRHPSHMCWIKWYLK
jgi:hypothetical protein